MLVTILEFTAVITGYAKMDFKVYLGQSGMSHHSDQNPGRVDM